jgi:hypothetical protein
MNIEINLKDVCLDLLVLRKHMYNCNRLFKAADHMYIVHVHVGVRTCTVNSGESTCEGAAVIVSAST